ncbi:MAG: hypothetical protein QW332_06195, partial [Thermoproteota archaeon]
ETKIKKLFFLIALIVCLIMLVTSLPLIVLFYLAGREQDSNSILEWIPKVGDSIARVWDKDGSVR